MTACSPEPPRLPLDRDNPRQWQSYHYADGRVLTSREINWRNVDLHALVEVQFHIKGQEWGLRRCDCPATFVEFVVFRTGGSDLRVVKDRDGERLEIIPHQSWTYGFTDGVTEFLDSFCWKTGRHLKRYTLPHDYLLYPCHFHSESRRVISAQRIEA